MAACYGYAHCTYVRAWQQQEKIHRGTGPLVEKKMPVSAKASKTEVMRTGTIERARKMTDLTSKDVRLGTVLLSMHTQLTIAMYVRTQLAIATSQKQVKYRKNDPSTEKTNAGALSETDAGILFIANLPHNSKSSLTPYVRTRTLLAIATAVRLSLIHI